MGLERLAWINFWSLNGPESLIRSRDGKIYRGLFSLVDILERDSVWGDRWFFPVSVPLDCHLEGFRCQQKIVGEENSIWLSGMAFHSFRHHGLSFRVFRFQIGENNPA